MEPSPNSSANPYLLHGRQGTKPYLILGEPTAAPMEECHARKRELTARVMIRQHGYCDCSFNSGNGFRQNPFHGHPGTVQRAPSTGSEIEIGNQQLSPAPAHHHHPNHASLRAMNQKPFPCKALCPGCPYGPPGGMTKYQRERMHSTVNQFDSSLRYYPTIDPCFGKINDVLKKESVSGKHAGSILVTNSSQGTNTSIPPAATRSGDDLKNPFPLSATGGQVLPHGGPSMKASNSGTFYGQPPSRRCCANCSRMHWGPSAPRKFYAPVVITGSKPAGPSGEVDPAGDLNDRRHRSRVRVLQDSLFAADLESSGSNEGAAGCLDLRGKKTNDTDPVTFHYSEQTPTDYSRPSKVFLSRNWGYCNLGRMEGTCRNPLDYHRAEMNSGHQPLGARYYAFDTGHQTNHGCHPKRVAVLQKEDFYRQKNLPSRSVADQRPCITFQHQFPRQPSSEEHVQQCSSANVSEVNGGCIPIDYPRPIVYSFQGPDREPKAQSPEDLNFHFTEDRQDRGGSFVSTSKNENRWIENSIQVGKGDFPDLKDKISNLMGSQPNILNWDPSLGDTSGTYPVLKKNGADTGRTHEHSRGICPADDAELPLLQEHLRVLLWALVGSERLEAAALASGGRSPICPRGPARWCQTPVEDLLRAILGACDCRDCRRRHDFRTLALGFLNECPPLSERLARDPRDLGTVVASVYHNDLMPSMRRREADFPEGVRQTLTRVARLEWVQNRVSLQHPRTERGPELKGGREEKEESSLREYMLRKEQPLLEHKDASQNTDREKNSTQRERCQATTTMRIKQIRKSEVEKMDSPIVNSHQTLHPHHQFLIRGMAARFQHHKSRDSLHLNNDLCWESKEDPKLPHVLHEAKTYSDVKPGDDDGVKKGDKLPIVKKRGRPPKQGPNRSTGLVRRKRMLLWKFLIALLDDEDKTKMKEVTTLHHNLKGEDSPDCSTNPLTQQADVHRYGMSGGNTKLENLGNINSVLHTGCHLHAHWDSREPELSSSPPSDQNSTFSIPNSPKVQWICRVEGLFQIIDSTALARFWGEKNNNPKMTYEKMSRAMRTYYRQNILMPVPRSYNLPKKLVYKFNPEILKK